MGSLCPAEQANDFLDRPDMIRDARFYRWRDAEGLMHAALQLL
jgi:hypothetical protein